jgi:hypothetical protein
MVVNKRFARFVGGFCVVYGLFPLLAHVRLTVADIFIVAVGVCFSIHGFSKD